MKYPNHDDIVDPAAKLSPEVASEIVPYVQAAQRRYRRFRQRLRTDTNIWREEPTIVVDHAADVFKKLVALGLQKPSADFSAYRRSIGWEGGAAEIAFWYAHHLYKDVQRGRMPHQWQWNELEPRLHSLIEDAEDLWHNQDCVPAGWEDFLGSHSATAATPDEESQPSAVRERLDAADPGHGGEATRSERKSPSSFFERYRVKHPGMSYERIAAKIGISRDCLFRIKGEKAWVRDYAYECAAQVLGCRPEDLRPRNLVREARRSRTTSGDTRTDLKTKT